MRLTLRTARLRAGLSQAKLAERVGLSRAAYTNIEKGHRNPSLVTAVRIARVLEKHVEDLFTDELSGGHVNTDATTPDRIRTGHRVAGNPV